MKNRILSVLLCLLLVAATTLPALSPILAPVEVQAMAGDGVNGFNTNNLVFTAACIAGYGSPNWSQDNLWWTSRTDTWAYNAECAYDATIDALHLYGKSGGGRIRFNLNSVLSARGGYAQPMSKFDAIRLIYRPYQGAVDSSIGVQVHSSAAPSPAVTDNLGLRTSDGIYTADFGFGTLGGNLDCVLIDLEGRLWLYAIMLFKVNTTNGSYNYYDTCCSQHGGVQLVFNGNGGSGHSPTSRSAIWSYSGNTIWSAAATEPSRTGYRFKYWQDGTGATVEAGGAIKVTKFNTGKKETATWDAQWDANEYTVNYDGNGNTGGSTAATEHTYGVAANLRANGFTRTGYTFAGWAKTSDGSVAYINQESVSNLTSTHGGSVTLYAKWTANEYTVSYNGNDNTGGSTASSTHTYDVAKALTANGFTKTGYTFAGWATSSGGSVAYRNQQSVKNLATSGTVTLYAKWSPITYTVAYNGNGHTGGSMANSSHTYDEAKNLTTNAFTKNGYTFGGWKTSADATSISYSNGQSVSNLTTANGGTVNLYAHWTPKDDNTITYNTAGGSAVSTQTYITDASITLAGAPTKTGYTFVGWKPTSTDGNWSSGDTFGESATTSGKYGNVTLTAQWTADNYTLTFDGNGVANPDDVVYTIESTGTLPTPTRTGYTFNGWKPADSVGAWDANTTYAGGTSLEGKHGTVKLVAQWTANTYTVKYNANGGTGSMDDSTHTYEVYSNLTLNTFVRPGYTFTGWNKKADGSGKSFTDGQEVYRALAEGSITLYAQWTANTYTVTLNENGGDDVSDVTYTVQDSIDLPTPTRAGYDFLGWMVTEVADGAEGWTLNDTVTEVPNGALGTVTLTAQWKSRGVPITYHIPNGLGTLTATEDFVNALDGVANTGSAVESMTDGYVFAGWYTDSTYETPVNPDWVDANGKLTVDLSGVDFSEWPESYEFYAKVEYDIKTITLSAACTEYPDQTFIYKITGTPELTDVFGDTISFEVTLLSGESAQVVMPLGDYIVTEYTDWSWRYTDPEDDDETEDVERDAAIISRYDSSTEWLFTYTTPTNSLWLNSYSVISGPGKEIEITS